jgi:hypothetical protein
MVSNMGPGETRSKMRRVLPSCVFVAGLFLTLLSVLILGTSSNQIRKNKIALSDMQAVVQRIREFKTRAGRLPTEEELHHLGASGFRFGAPPRGSAPELHAQPGGWIIWYWRGEWSEYYTSWDDHYSLEEGISLMSFCGPFFFLPAAAALCLVLSFALKSEPLFSVRQLTR